jgi:putative chitinase
VITPALLLRVFPGSNDAVAALWQALDDSVHEFEVARPRRLAAFLAQVGHESARLTRLEENLNYSGDALWRVFRRHFADPAEAGQYHRQPERIANRVYANRMGNRDEASGDGWRYRGRGLIQVTGTANYRACSEALFGDRQFLLDHPEELARPVTACRSAGWYWRDVAKANTLADQGTESAFREITRRINGGFHGMDDRLGLWRRAKDVLGVQAPQEPAREHD